MATTTKVHVFVNRRKVEFPTDQVTREGLLADAGFDPQHYDLYHLQGEGDPSGGTLIQAGETVHLKNGEHYRAIPGNLTFGRV